VWILEGERVKQPTRRWGTLTDEVMALADWLEAHAVTHVGMESTGVFWKPIYNILEGRFTVIWVNARHLKQVPGRKTDTRDSQWGAQLLQCGLRKGSFIPPRWQRELRDLTRHRTQLVAEQTRVANRLHKVLEDANIKLGSVATDILGVSGRAMIQALIQGEEDATKLAALAQGKLRSKRPELQRALQGRMTEHHRFMLGLLCDELAALDKVMGKLEKQIAELTRPYATQIEQMDSVPGIDRRVAEVVLAEAGPDMSRFPTDGHLSSWSGMSPGSDESAGKRRSGRTTKGDRWLRTALVQAAWAATRSKHTYLAAQFHHLVGRRGKKRSLVAVGHSILVILYHLLKDGTFYAELGEDYFQRLHPQRQTRYHVKCLQRLGHQVVLQPSPA
jgi:transposase